MLVRFRLPSSPSLNLVDLRLDIDKQTAKLKVVPESIGIAI